MRINLKTAFSILSTSFMLTSVAYSAVIPVGTELADKQEITINNGNEPTSIDPHKIEGYPEAEVVYQLFEGLVTKDEEGKAIPGIAESWKSSEDFKTWTFTLREGAKWSNDEPVTSYDFEFSFRRLADPKTASPYASYLEYLQIQNAKDVIAARKPVTELGVRAVDDRTLEFTLSSPIPYLVDMMTHFAVLPVNKSFVEKYSDDWVKQKDFPVNGAYALADHVVNEKIVFVRNKKYWNDKETVIEKATFLPIESANTDVLRYRAGDLQITNYQIPPEQFKTLKRELPNELRIVRMLGTYMYQINNSKSPLTDVRIRKALNLSLDRNILTDKVLAQGQTPTYVFTPPYITDGELIKQPEYSKQDMASRNAEAVKLLNEAGYSKSNPLKLTVLYFTNDENKKIAVAVQSIWKKNTDGILDIKLQSQEWKTYLNTLREKKYDIARAGWTADYNQASTFGSYFLSDSSNNTAFYMSEAYDSKFNESYNSSTAKGRAEAYAAAEAQLAEDYGTIPFFNRVNIRLVKPTVGGYTGKDPQDVLFLRNFYIKK
ncbi:oligopeptide ABC transporter, oligopeptide-binding protein [Taylorella equigenitalis 14/56]|uniref:Oligopeptide ABC transporter, oligopeptide-binding protein n=1 Tax=Taylorella equigenitalis 14/56 TaxID=1091497 RepID=I7JJE6_9BURK|nr:ABC transporter substrate-binding protein [Taylorella equigenitalis]CCG17866.1 oligopeptide ABC transporter, oligopeptide-binding protein [Taylorella equigenitalis 14/56]